MQKAKKKLKIGKLSSPYGAEMDALIDPNSSDVVIVYEAELLRSINIYFLIISILKYKYSYLSYVSFDELIDYENKDSCPNDLLQVFCRVLSKVQCDDFDCIKVELLRHLSIEIKPNEDDGIVVTILDSDSDYRLFLCRLEEVYRQKSSDYGVYGSKSKIIILGKESFGALYDSCMPSIGAVKLFGLNLSVKLLKECVSYKKTNSFKVGYLKEAGVTNPVFLEDKDVVYCNYFSLNKFMKSLNMVPEMRAFLVGERIRPSAIDSELFIKKGSTVNVSSEVRVLFVFVPYNCWDSDYSYREFFQNSLRNIFQVHFIQYECKYRHDLPGPKDKDDFGQSYLNKVSKESNIFLIGSINSKKEFVEMVVNFAFNGDDEIEGKVKSFIDGFLVHSDYTFLYVDIYNLKSYMIERDLCDG